MSRPKLKFIFVAALVWLVSVQRLPAQLAVGDKFPALEQMALEGKLPTVSDRVVLVDFWASWCAPCKASFPALVQLQAWYAQRGVVVLGVSVDEDENDYAAFLKKQAPSFSVVRDAAHKLVAMVQVPVMPTTYVIGKDGRIRAILSGYHGKETDKALRAVLNATLAENSSATP